MLGRRWISSGGALRAKSVKRTQSWTSQCSAAAEFFWRKTRAAGGGVGVPSRGRDRGPPFAAGGPEMVRVSQRSGGVALSPCAPSGGVVRVAAGGPVPIRPASLLRRVNLRGAGGRSGRLALHRVSARRRPSFPSPPAPRRPARSAAARARPDGPLAAPAPRQCRTTAR